MDRTGRPEAGPLPLPSTVLGVMNEFTVMAEDAIGDGRADSADLLGLWVWLADTIVVPNSKDDGFTPLGALQRVVRKALPDQ